MQIYKLAKMHEPTTACISHCWQRICGGYHSWLGCGNQTTKRIGNATEHIRGRCAQFYKRQCKHLNITK